MEPDTWRFRVGLAWCLARVALGVRRGGEVLGLTRRWAPEGTGLGLRDSRPSKPDRRPVLLK